jgi:hypothetical protein
MLRSCLRELPPLHAVLDGLLGLSLLVTGGYAAWTLTACSA